jgi:hypothetical protein
MSVSPFHIYFKKFLFPCYFSLFCYLFSFIYKRDYLIPSPERSLLEKEWVVSVQVFYAALGGDKRPRPLDAE